MTKIEEFGPDHIQQLYQLYQDEWWTKGRSLEETAAGLAGSQIKIGMVDSEGRLCGFVRVLTDYVFKAVIFDLLVSPGSREKGVGARLMEAVKLHPRLAGVRHFELYCLPELVSYYERHGFSDKVEGVRLMRRRLGE